MVLEVTAQGIVAFGLAVGLLVMVGTMDIKTRKVSNDIMAIAIAIGSLTGIVTGHLLDQAFLHLIAFIVTLLLVIPLFYKGAIGGADTKTVMLLAVISPGFEFGQYSDPIFEGILGVLVPLLVMFVMGSIYSKKKVSTDSRRTPLIPFLFIGYLIVQLLVLF
ncbi:MAG: hypothetical protein P1Q69_03825 [Candidatus Thorarchaeota archaeon]|nr:hypothetical protein [Candidatus Thorarchaeota archaeon]